MSKYGKKTFAPLHLAERPHGQEPRPADRGYYSLFCYLWDVLDQGVTSFARVVSDLGLTHISIAASYHGGKALLPHNRTQPVYFIEDGAVYFRPAPRVFPPKTMQPRVSSLVKKRDSFRDLVDECWQRGVKTTAWTVALHNTHLGTAYPQYTSQNVFGNRYLYALCPSQPAVLRYLRSLAQNLALYNIDAVEFETFEYVPFRNYAFLEKEGIAVSPMACLLLSLCFCPACLGIATSRKIPTHLLIKGVKGWLRSYFDGEKRSQDPAGEQIPAIAGLQNYLEMRFDVLSAAFAEVSGELQGQRKKVIFLSIAQEQERDNVTGIDLKRLAQCSDAVETLFYARRPEEAIPLISALQCAMSMEREIYCAIRPGYPDADSADAVETLTRSVLDAGAAGVSYYNFGLIEKCRFPWIRRAIAEARGFPDPSKRQRAAEVPMQPISTEGQVRPNVLRKQFDRFAR